MVEKFKVNRLKIVIFTTITTFLLYLNYESFTTNISSNPKALVTYKQSVDELHNYRTPQIAALLYEKGNNFQKPKIIISPKERYLPFLHEKYAQRDQNINSIILDPIKDTTKINHISAEQNLIPVLIELNSENLDNYRIYYDEKDHIANLKNFVSDYEGLLKEIIIKSIESNRKPFAVSKKNYAHPIFDKGNSFVFDGNIEAGSLNTQTGIGQDIANNIFLAKKMGVNLALLKIFILTDFKPISYVNDENLYQQLIPNVDGVVLRDGYRQAVFLPYMWQKYTTAEEFINNLKLKATLLPNYNSPNIKFYRFQTIEIK